MIPTAKAHAFVADLAAPALDAADRHHLERVLRLRPGDELTVADGLGRWRLVRFGPELRVAGDVEEEPVPPWPLAVGFALTKGDKPELVVQKLTELGADRIVAFQAERSVVRWDPDRAARQVERLRRVAREAAVQCRRARLPVVDDVVAFATLAAERGAVLAERDGRPPRAGDLILVGPEGGWSAQERAAGLPAVALGGHVLRAETAAVAAGVLLAALRGRLVQPAEQTAGNGQ